MMKNLLLVAVMTAIASAQSTYPTFSNQQHETFGIGSWDMRLLNYYVSSGVVAGIAVFLTIILTFLFATCQLLAVQSPPTFLDKSIDWGKQEDVE